MGTARWLGSIAALGACLLVVACSGTDGPAIVDDAPAGDRDAGSASPPAADPEGAPPGNDDAAVPDAGSAPAEVDVDQIPWETGASVGFGVAKKDTGNTRGNNVFIAYAGFGIDLEGAKAWSSALFRASLKARGVRYIWAVQGPSSPEYDGMEIGNSKIVAGLLPVVNASTKFILVAGHSSGSFVAHELLAQLEGGLDPQNVTASRVVYFNLDGGKAGLTTASVGRLRKAYFVTPRDPALPTTKSTNYTPMMELANEYGSGSFLQLQATSSGCNAGAKACLHLACITTKPHDPSGNASGELDYTSFAGRAVVSAYIDAKATEASLVP
jgi:hypothetical protein